MSREEVLRKVNEIFVDAFDKKDLVISFDTTSSDVEGWDSLMQMNLIEMIEDEFNMRFDMDEVLKMANVGAMIDIIIATMNHYSFDEIEIGINATFESEITADKMKLFAEISGDFNPMHTDDFYAKLHGYPSKVVYGMLSSSLYSALVGMYLPGERCLLNKCEVNYRKPVYVGDKLFVYGEVVDKRIATRRIKIKGKMNNQNGVIVNTADITVCFTE